MQDIDIFQLVILFSISFMSAFSVELNNYANDKNKNKQSIPLLYISECLVSGLSGFFVSIILIVLKQKILVCILAAGIGGFIGRKLLFALIKVAIIIFSIKKNVDISKLEELLSTLDYRSDDNSDNNNRNMT